MARKKPLLKKTPQGAVRSRTVLNAPGSPGFDPTKFTVEVDDKTGNERIAGTNSVDPLLYADNSDKKKGVAARPTIQNNMDVQQGFTPTPPPLTEGQKRQFHDAQGSLRRMSEPAWSPKEDDPIEPLRAEWNGPSNREIEHVVTKMEAKTQLSSRDNRVLEWLREEGLEPNDPLLQRLQAAGFGPHPNEVAAEAAGTIIGTLPNDAPGDDRTDNALKNRFMDQQRQQALDWLIGSAGIGASKADPGGVKPQPFKFDPTTATPEFRQMQAEGGEAIKAGVGAVASDIGGGLAEAGTQVLGGARDAAQAAIDGIDALGDGLAGLAAENTILETKRNADKYAATPLATLPEVQGPQTVTGGLIRSVAQFLIGFGVAGKTLGLGAAATKTGQAATAGAKGFASDFAFFQGQDANLARLVQENPELANPVTEFLATAPDDNEALNRFKRALEGLGLGTMVPAIVPAVASIRNARAMGAASGVGEVGKDAKVGATLLRTEPAPLAGARSDVFSLGAADAPLTVRLGDDAAHKLLEAATETETGLPVGMTAKALTDRGLTQLGTDDVFINFDRISAPDDIKRVLQDVSTAFKPSIDDATRGTRTNAQTIEAAGDIDAFNVVMQRRKGQALNAEETHAVRVLWTAAADNLQKLARDATANPTPENLFRFRRMFATFHAIQKEAFGARAEAGRALQAWAIPVGGSLEQMQGITKALDEVGGVEASMEMARKIAVTNDRAVIGEFAEKSVYAKTRDSVHEFWINAILSGPQTHLANIISNVSVAGLVVFERAVAAGFGRLVGSQSAVQMGEATAMLHGAVAGFKDALRNAAKTWETGQTGYGMNKIEGPRERAISSTNYNIKSDTTVGRAVDAIGAVVNVSGKALQTEDEFFKTIGYRMSLHRQAYLQAGKEVQAGTLTKENAKARIQELVDNPTESMRLDARAAAAYQTFTDEPGPFVKTLMDMRRQAPLVGKFAIPFVLTPANIFKFVAERTPLAPLTARFQAAIAKGGAEKQMALTKMALGTMVTMTAIDLAMNGHATGSGPSNAAEAANLRRQGWQPNSIKIGDRYFAYNRLDPVGSLLGLGAQIGEYISNSGASDDEVENLTRAIALTIFSAADTATSKTYLQGLADLVEAINDPERFATTWLKKFGGSFVPAIVNFTAKSIDPTQRETVGVVEQMLSRIPGASMGLPPRRDAWGREIRYESGMGQAYDALSPIYSSTYKPQPIDAVMLRDGWFLGMPQKAFTVDGARVSLIDHPDIYSRFLEVRGTASPSQMGDAGMKPLKGNGSVALVDLYGDQNMLETLNSIVTGKHKLSADYTQLDGPEAREDFIRRVVDRYQNAAKVVIFQEFPYITDKAARINATVQ